MAKKPSLRIASIAMLFTWPACGGGETADPPLYPSPPRDVRITSVGWDQVTLAWDSGPDAQGFEVAWLAPDSEWVVLSPTLSAASRSEPIDGLDAGTRYGFRIRALGSEPGHESDWSEEAVVRTLALPSLRMRRMDGASSPFADGLQSVRSIAAWFDANEDRYLGAPPAGEAEEDGLYPIARESGCDAVEGRRFAEGTNVIVYVELEHPIAPDETQFTALHLQVEDGAPISAKMLGGDLDPVTSQGRARVLESVGTMLVDLGYAAEPSSAKPGRIVGTVTATLAGARCPADAMSRVIVELDFDLPLDAE